MTPTGSHRIITGLVPCNVIPDEILTDHPDRFRALLVESANPVHSLADSERMREALRALDLVVVIDVALTETARQADYVLPAASQFEKWECTFFTLEFPHNVFHLRRPVFEPMPGTLPEPEIHARLCRALGAYTDDDLAPLAEAAAEGRGRTSTRSSASAPTRPELGKLLPVLLYETLGPTLTTPDGVPAAGAAALWGLAHRCALAYPDSIRRAGIEGDGVELGEALFDAILANPSGVTFTVDDYDETMRRMETPDGRVTLAIPSCSTSSAVSPTSGAARRGRRVPVRAVRRRAPLVDGQHDLPRPGVAQEGRPRALRIARPTPTRSASPTATGPGAHEARSRRSPSSRSPTRCRPATCRCPTASASAPPSDVVGVAPNELTSTDDRDWFAGTPHHKHVPGTIERVDERSASDAPHPVRRLAVPDRPHDRPHRRLVDAARAARGVLREAPLRGVEQALGMPRAVLTAPAQATVRRGLLVAVPYQDNPVRYEYRLTDKGRAFWDVLAAMWRWGSDWLFDEDGPPVCSPTASRREVRPVVDELTGDASTSAARSAVRARGRGPLRRRPMIASR